MPFICPVCGENLIEGKQSFVCRRSHLFDKAKKGYVNLLLGHDGSQHGDSKPMALARYEVMQSGLYAPLKEALLAAMRAHLQAPCVIADCGCGECYYTCAVSDTFAQAEVLATDISKEALAVAKRRSPRFLRAVASSFNLPIASGSCDAALNIFSPFAKEEYRRILKPGGLLFMVIPLEKHLLELKQAVYESAYENTPKSSALEGFSLPEESVCDYRKTLSGAELSTLFAMTPYAIKTAPQDVQKLESIDCLEVQFSFKIFVYQKQR
ncbi:MAG: methyltransferase domain-containing protein [Clostridia bacterium]|nr:methyltransferase domain-containing protein [Clostridia bacterium]